MLLHMYVRATLVCDPLPVATYLRASTRERAFASSSYDLDIRESERDSEEALVSSSKDDEF